MAVPSGTGNYALQDIHIQLTLLEQQDKRRLTAVRQEQDSTALNCNDRSQLGPRVPPSRQSDLRHGLLTPGATPPNRSSRTPSKSPSPLAGVSNAPPFDPMFTRRIYNGPSLYPPQRGFGNPTPLQSQPTFHYSTSLYTQPACHSNGCREYLQNTQTSQIPTTNVLKYSTSPYTQPLCHSNCYQEYPQTPQMGQFPTTNVLEYSTNQYTNPLCDSNGYQEYTQNSQSGQFPTANTSECASNFGARTFLPEAYVGWNPVEMKCSPSCGSEESMESMTFSDTIDTVDFEALTPRGQWDELPDFTDFYAYDAKSKSSADSDASFGFFELCYGTPASPPITDLGLSTSISRKFNVNRLPSQAPTDRNLDMSVRLCPQAETPPKKDSRSQILSNDLEQGAGQSRYVANESGTERKEHQIFMSQNRNIASEPNCDKDIRITIEAPPLPCATGSASDTTSREDLAYYQRQTSSPSPTSASGSETCSWPSDNDTDWGDDASDDEHRAIGTPIIIESSNVLVEQELPNITKPVLSKMKQELVDRIMVEFWQIFNQEKETNMYNSHSEQSSLQNSQPLRYEDTISRSARLHECQEADTSHQDEQNTTPTSKSGTKSDVQINGTRPSGGQNGKRKRQGQDDEENDEAENRNPKKPKGLLSPPRNQDDSSKFACPYRKHDARKYCVRQWRSCALTPLETVARVK
jgi:hypothetical protein